MTRRGRLLALPCALIAALALALPAAGEAKVKLPRTFFGMISAQVGAYSLQPDLWNTDFAAMSKAGVGTFRQTFDAALPSDTLDEFVLTAARHRIAILPVLIDGKKFITEPGPDHGLYAPKSFKRLAKYATGLVKRYGPKGTLWTGANRKLRKYAIRSWQLWNEPNLTVWWKPKPKPKAYAKLVRVVSKAIRGADRHATIVSAGIPDSRQSKPRNYRQYLKAFLEAGGAKHVTAIGVNGYAHSVRGVKKILTTYRKLFDAHHAKKVKIVISEIGWADKGHRNPQVVGTRGQAKRITQMFKLVRQLRRSYKIIGMTYFDWRDYAIPPNDPKGDTWGYHTGLLKANGKPKPAYRAFKRGVKSLR